MPLRRSDDALGIVWVYGAAVALIFVGSRLFGSLQGESYETAQFLWISAGIPLLALLLGWPRSSEFVTRIRRSVALLFGAVFVIFSFVLTRRLATLPLVLFALAQIAILGVLARKWIAEEIARRNWTTLAANAISVIALSFVGWSSASKLIWWRPVQEWATESSSVWLFVAAAACVIGIGISPFGSVSRLSRRWTRGIDGAALAVFLLSSLRTNFDFFHTGFYVGPAELVRQGGWLLWDVPSQYGFLNILLIGILPGMTSWQAYWVLNGLLVFLSAAITYGLLRNLMTGARGIPAAFFTTLTLVFFLPGWGSDLAGPTIAASCGAMRFFFPYALTALAFWNLRKNDTNGWSRRRLALGHVVWLFGVLWAVESAVYSTLFWYSILVVLVWRRGLKSAWQALFAPPALLLAAWSLIALYYKARLGSFPDPLGYLDFALVYQGGYGALPIQIDGAVWVLVFLFCGIGYAAYLSIEKAPRLLDGIAAVGAVAVATATYFVSRSHENNAANLLPIFFGGLTFAVLSLETEPSLKPRTWLLRAALVPFLAIGFSVPLSAASARRLWWNGTFALPSPTRVHDAIPSIAAPAKALLAKAGVRAGDPVSFLGPDLIGRESVYKDWLPIAPAMEIDVLDVRTQDLYLDRFMNRAPSSGWLLTTNPMNRFNGKVPTIAATLFNRLARTHVLTARYEEQGSVLLHYERKTTP